MTLHPKRRYCFIQRALARAESTCTGTPGHPAQHWRASRQCHPSWTIARIGLGVFAEAIGTYMATVLSGLAIHAFIVLGLTCLIFARANPLKYMHQMRQALMTAMGTDSSSATLPVTIECATEQGGVSKKAAGFVLPLGATINMDGTALYEAVAVVFLAQAYGINLDLGTLILVAITATFAAIGAAGIPSAGLVTMVIVVETVNGTLAATPGSPSIPIAAIGLIVGVDRILDMCRTTVNVWGDAVGAKLIDRLERRPQT
ncbi:MAG: dicarboxylate/amino acid:cation symporter [Planctomycetes bacterium]|nr:dicarboxylate/amino acid:cation symporter [Planctomycetota bacterium]